MKLGVKLLAAASFAAASFASAPAFAEDIIIGLVTKTSTNPFFVKMKEGAEARAKELGVELRSFAGKYDGDNEAQIEAIESLVAAGAKGILITPSDPVGLADTVARAREAGVLVIALDTPFDPADVADATFATDNRKAGELIAEFVLYWRDSNQVHNSWNSRFLQYVKQQWGKGLAQHTGGIHEQQSNHQPGYSTAEASRKRLQDTNW